MKDVHKYALGVVGFVSGILSSYFFNMDNGGLLLGPGIVFGVCLALYFLLFKRELFPGLRILMALIFVAVSVFAFRVAVWVESYSLMGTFGFGGGIIGGAILLTGLSFLVYKLKPKHFWSLTFVAGILGLSLWLPFILDDTPSYMGLSTDTFALLPLFIIWQMGVAFSIGLILDKECEKQPDENNLSKSLWRRILIIIFSLAIIGGLGGIFLEFGKGVYYRQQWQKIVDIREGASTTGDIDLCLEVFNVNLRPSYAPDGTRDTQHETWKLYRQFKNCVQEAAVGAKDPTLCDFLTNPGDRDLCVKGYKRETEPLNKL